MKLQYTPAQYLEAVKRHGGSRIRAAEELGVHIRTLMHWLRVCRDRGEDVPEAPGAADAAALRAKVEAAHDSAPDGYFVKGVSTLHGAEGEVKQQWIKTDVDQERRLEMARAACEALKEEIPRQDPITAPAVIAPKLCNLYTITDYHVGMLAWRQEGGADWDLQIAERTLMRCFRAMVDGAPPAKVGVVNQLGDFLHTDGFQPLTPASKHVLDADSRFPKIVQVAVRGLRALVNMALEKHEQVHVIMAEGNHDPASAVWLRAMFHALYENEPRVTVETSPLPFYAYQHGATMLGFHHGHLKKIDKMQGVMAAQFPKMWGETTHRYCHMGHLHHTHEKEDNGMTVTQHPTLASRDAYGARGAWYADRGARCITYHNEHGEVGRTMITPEMVS